ncbi:MAG: hypothetical protein ACTHM6_02445 [Tepidisphaeraceae bacterium]
MLAKLLRGTAFWIAVALLVWGGLRLRAAVWEWTIPIRFNSDVNNGFRWGTFASRVGYWNVYDELGRPERDAFFLHLLDYGPLRLGVMSAWVNWVHVHYPGVTEREPSAAFHAPLLWFNTAIEALTALATFLLVLLASRPRRGLVWVALGGAALTWLNPLIIFNAHGWPQWDIWPMPFFLFALCCGLRRRWLLAGAFIGCGAMLKGQLLMAAWALPIWALLLGDWRGALRFCLGAAAALLLIGAVWELSIYLPGPGGFDRYVAAGNAGPLRRVDWPALLWVMVWVCGAIALPRRFSMTALCLALVVGLGSTYWLFNASPNWFISGIVVGTWHYPAMCLGSVSNLPALLAARFGWNDPMTVLFDLGSTDPSVFPYGPLPITLRTLLLAIFFLTSAWCIVWAAYRTRRRDPRLLLAICLPWLLFYTVPAQVHERYLIFFSACTGAFIACGPRWVWLGTATTLIGLANTMRDSFGDSGTPPWGPSHPGHSFWTVVCYVIDGLQPGLGWMVLLIAAILLYAIASPRPADAP